MRSFIAICSSVGGLGLLLLYLTHQDHITHNLPFDAQIYMQFRHVWSFDLAVRSSPAKTPKVCGAMNVLSLEFSSVAS